ncbi:PAS domain S-box protein [Methanosarcina sp. MSH10X1]|uniref:PAS domain S-box protein n=1 Tax=Methanosarcina sp. MSH10X1 TaxID=2507075 RepID=UPI000FFC1395|nr:PAS domain S-box protein [Methanosarcina sp. MSH10X1]RXA19856.1 PAS domain S-box protein [Methanosarcina sp. MSH10X1]
MKNDTGNSGIDIIGNVTWGTHFCQFYQTEEDLMDILVPYLKTGLENNELCIWVMPKFIEAEKAEQLLKIAFPDIDIYLKKGQIEILSCAEWYLRENIFDSQKTLNDLIERIDRILASGYTGLRLIEDICLPEKESLNNLVDYERKMDSVLEKYPVIALCTYSPQACNAANIVEIVSSHQFTLIKKEGKWEQIESSWRKNLTKLRRAEEALRKTEEHYRILFTNMTESFALTEVIFDEYGKPYDYRYLEINPAYELSLGMKKEDLLGRTLLEVFPNTTRTTIEKFGEVMSSGRSMHFEIFSPVVNKYIDIYAFSPEKGKLAFIFRDISERRKAEDALRKSEERYRTLFTNMTEGFVLAEVIFDEDGKPYDYRYLEVNPVYERSTGFKREEVLGKSILKVVPNVSPTMIKKLGEVALSGRPAHFEIFSQITGKYFDTYVFNPERGKIAATFRDITARKQAEEALRENEARLRVIVANSPDIIFEQDRDLHYTWIYNPAPPLSASDVIGKTDADLLPPDQAQQLESIKRRVLETGSHEQAFLQLSPGGETRWFESIYEPRYNAAGQITGVLSYTRDVTERKQAEEALQQSRNTLQAVIDAAPAGIIVAQANGKILLANANTQRILGGPMTGDAHRPAGGYKVTLPDGTPVPAGELPLSLALEGQTVTDTELIITRDDGTQIVILASATPLQENHGKPWGAIALLQDITERKNVEKKLQESEEKYRNIVETATEGIWIGDPEARTIYVNKRMAEMLGYTQDEMIGKFAWDFADEAGRPLIKGYIERRWQGIDERYEFKFIRKDGSPLWAIVSSKALFDKAGKFTGSMSMLTDITGRKEAEAKLKETLDNLEEKVKQRTMQLEKAYKSLEESEKRLAEAQRMAHLGNWEWDTATDKVYWSDEAYRIFGLEPQEFEITFSTFLNYVHPDDRGYVNNAIKRALSGESYNIDFRIILAEGEERIVHAQGEAVFDEKNTPVLMKGTVQDITERKRAEDNLRSSEERYRSFIENFKGIAFQADENFIPVFMHGTVKEITGYDEEEFISKRRWKDIIHPDDLPRIYEEEERVRNSQYKASGEVDFRITHKDGKIKWVHEIYQKIPGKNGIPDKYQGAIYDITERKEAEETLVKIDRIRIKEIHHRIKNNLQVISSLLDLQAETFSQLETCKTPEVVQAFMESQSRVISMALIHEELYKGDKIDTLDFSAYLRKLTAELFSSYSLRNKNIGLKLDLELVDLGLDTAIPLGIIVNELVSNAFKHAFPAGREGEIRINLRRTGIISQRDVSGQVKSCRERNGFDYMLTVVDNGKGVPEGIDLENTDSLGLQLVSLLVEQIESRIELKSDQGTEFTIWFNDIKT